MKRILVISDSHGDIDVMYKILQEEKYDIAVHLGDHLISETKMDAWFDYYVAGNNDFSNHIEENFVVGAFHFYVQHGHFLPLYKKDEKLVKLNDKFNSDIILFGHTHIPKVFWDGKKGLFNPGSITEPRNGIPSYGIITIIGNEIDFEIKKVTY